jgi:hypothetical protein
MRACTAIMALWLLATLSGIFPLVTACMNWSGDIASRLLRSAGVAALEPFEEALVPLAGALAPSALELLLSAAPSAAALDVEAGFEDPVADVLEVSADVDAAAFVVPLPDVVDGAVVPDAVPVFPPAMTGDVGRSAWVRTIGRWPGR